MVAKKREETARTPKNPGLFEPQSVPTGTFMLHLHHESGQACGGIETGLAARADGAPSAPFFRYNSSRVRTPVSLVDSSRLVVMNDVRDSCGESAAAAGVLAASSAERVERLRCLRP